MLKKIFCWTFPILNTLTILALIVSEDDEECRKATEKLKYDFYCDKFLISQFYTEIHDIKRLTKYINHKMVDIDKELNETCTNFFGFLQEQSLQCTEKILHSTCRHAMTKGSGVYEVKSTENDKYFVYCEEDPNGGEPWTVIQRRTRKTGTFNREMYDYVNGFGDILDNFWMGLEKIHELTIREPHELWIKIISGNNTVHAKYDLFAIAEQIRNYSIYALGNYNGTAGDALRLHEGYGFNVYRSTSDQKDKLVDCARRATSGWWFNMFNCGECNLNGPYPSNDSDKNFMGINWGKYMPKWNSKYYCHMAIREKYSEYC